MGMFDTIEVKDVECPNCNHIFNDDFQTKSLGKNLDYYKVGDTCKNLPDINFLLGEAHGNCPKCNDFFDVYFTVIGREYKGLFNPTDLRADVRWLKKIIDNSKV